MTADRNLLKWIRRATVWSAWFAVCIFFAIIAINVYFGIKDTGNVPWPFVVFGAFSAAGMFVMYRFLKALSRYVDRQTDVSNRK